MATFKELLESKKFEIQGFMDPDKYYETWEFSDEETIARVWDKEALKNLVGRRAFFAANEQRQREIAQLWVTEKENRDTACLGSNYGYYVGLDAINQHYVIDYEKKRWDDLKKVPGVDQSSKNLGTGCTSFNTATTPLLRIAGDGRTARGLWYCIGQETRPNGDGSAQGWWIYQTMGVDFVKEAAGWRIWHLVECIDYVCQASVSFQAGDVDGIDEEKYFEESFGNPTTSMKVHDPRYNWADNFPAMPLPYYTFKPENGYGPEGNPYYRGVKK